MSGLGKIGIYNLIGQLYRPQKQNNNLILKAVLWFIKKKWTLKSSLVILKTIRMILFCLSLFHIDCVDILASGLVFLEDSKNNVYFHTPNSKQIAY